LTMGAAWAGARVLSRRIQVLHQHKYRRREAVALRGEKIALRTTTTGRRTSNETTLSGKRDSLWRENNLKQKLRGKHGSLSRRRRRRRRRRPRSLNFTRPLPLLRRHYTAATTLLTKLAQPFDIVHVSREEQQFALPFWNFTRPLPLHCRHHRCRWATPATPAATTAATTGTYRR